MAFVKKLGMATRDAYGKALVEVGEKNPDVIVLDGDLAKSTKTVHFAMRFPERFYNIGIQEANMAGIAGGLASAGKIPFISSFACFMICKGYDQLRMAVAFPELNVKVVASHGGISVGEDGASQQSIEDFALAAALPGFTVMSPSDEFCARALTHQLAEMKGPVYMRTGRSKAAIIHNENTKFEIGKGIILREGADLTFIANGLLVAEAMLAADVLSKEGIEATVVDMHTIKPLDEALITSLARKTGAIIVCEEHQIWGGLGSAVATCVARNHPCPMEFVALQDTFAESGAPDELMEKYGFTAPALIETARRLAQTIRA